MDARQRERATIRLMILPEVLPIRRVTVITRRSCRDGLELQTSTPVSLRESVLLLCHLPPCPAIPPDGEWSNLTFEASVSSVVTRLYVIRSSFVHPVPPRRAQPHAAMRNLGENPPWTISAKPVVLTGSSAR